MKLLTKSQVRELDKLHDQLSELSNQLQDMDGRLCGGSVFVGEEGFDFFKTDREIASSSHLPKRLTASLHEKLCEVEAALMGALMDVEELETIIEEKLENQP